MTTSDAITITYREAVRAAMREALLADERVFLMGEDVGRYGGCFAVSKGLLEEFGPERVRDTPLSESAFVGAGIGAALGGMRPIVEVMTVNFSLLALDQIVNNAATLRHMSGGQFSVPLVIRMATGGGRQVAAQHSHSLEGWYAHIPGSSCSRRRRSTTRAACSRRRSRDPNPVFIFEHGCSTRRRRAAATRTPVDIDARRRPPRRERRDADHLRRLAAERTRRRPTSSPTEGIEAEVIDLRVLRPLDDATMLASVARTHRAVIVDEGWRTGSLAAEISARIMEQAFYELDAPVARVCCAEVPMPYPRAPRGRRAAAGRDDRGRRSCGWSGGMAEFVMPSLGADMEAGTLLEWLVKPGDAVKRGDIVAVVETTRRDRGRDLRGRRDRRAARGRRASGSGRDAAGDDPHAR